MPKASHRPIQPFAGKAIANWNDASFQLIDVGYAPQEVDAFFASIANQTVTTIPEAPVAEVETTPEVEALEDEPAPVTEAPAAEIDQSSPQVLHQDSGVANTRIPPTRRLALRYLPWDRLLACGSASWSAQGD